MKIYRTTRYSSTGTKLWERLSDSQHVYSGTAGDVQYGGYVTLEVTEVDDSQFEQVKVKGRVPFK